MKIRQAKKIMKYYDREWALLLAGKREIGRIVRYDTLERAESRIGRATQ